jgi:hypothetical protein
MADVTFTVDAPGASSGSWWVDVQRYGRVASIEWKPGKGFGVAAPQGGYGEGVDLIVDDAAAAAEYVARVLQPRSAAVGGDDVLPEGLASALSAHMERIVAEIVHTTIEKLLVDLRTQVSEVSADVQRVERELSRIGKTILSERTSSAEK